MTDGISVSVKADIDKATRGLLLMQRDINKAAVAALNKVAVTARARAARTISAETSMPVNEVRGKVPLIRANRMTLEATIKAVPWAPNLIRYGARKTKAGISAKAWGKRKIYKGTFFGNMGRTVFTRTSADRLPIKSVRGPSVRRQFIRGHTIAAIKQTVAERFPLEFDRALRALLRRGAR